MTQGVGCDIAEFWIGVMISEKKKYLKFFDVESMTFQIVGLLDLEGCHISCKTAWCI